jgi:hypothetical protein
MSGPRCTREHAYSVTGERGALLGHVAASAEQALTQWTVFAGEARSIDVAHLNGAVCRAEQERLAGLGSRGAAHGPYETDRDAARDSAHVYDAYRGNPEQGLIDRINEGLLLAALNGAGVELGAYDRRIAGWLAGWEPQVLQVVIGWIERAHQAEQPDAIALLAPARSRHGESVDGGQGPECGSPDDEPVMHWPARGLRIRTACQGTPLTPESFASREPDVTCPECLALLPTPDGGS